MEVVGYESPDNQAQAWIDWVNGSLEVQRLLRIIAGNSLGRFNRRVHELSLGKSAGALALFLKSAGTLERAVYDWSYRYSVEVLEKESVGIYPYESGDRLMSLLWPLVSDWDAARKMCYEKLVNQKWTQPNHKFIEAQSVVLLLLHRIKKFREHSKGGGTVALLSTGDLVKLSRGARVGDLLAYFGLGVFRFRLPWKHGTGPDRFRFFAQCQRGKSL